MKKNLLLPILASVFSSVIYTGGIDLDLHHLFSKCSGNNAYCYACRSCAKCKHCADEGGSCAVCYTPKRVVARPVQPARRTSPSHGASRIYAPARTKTYPRRQIDFESPNSQEPVVTVNPKPEVSPARVATVIRRDDNHQNPPLETPNKFLAPQPKTDEKYSVAIPDDAQIVMVIVNKANLRELATTESAIIEEIPYGSLLMKLGESGDWIKVQTIDTGTAGFILSKIVQ